MKLSDARIRKLSKAMAREMMRRGAISAATPDDPATVIAKAMIGQAQIEDAIEAEARGMVARQRNLVPGTGEYQAAFQQARRAAAAKRGLKY